MNLFGRIGNESKILVTGGSGLVGTHLKKYLPNATYISSTDYNLTNESDVSELMSNRWDVVIHLAAKVGGILDNIHSPATYIEDNILMNSLLLKYAKLTNVDRFIGILSTCIYPDINHRYPIYLEDLHLGPPTPTNFSYGYAKRLLAVQIDSYNKQYGTNWNYLVPCNLYGPNDKDDTTKSHFVTALIKKIYEAKLKNSESITLFGDGTPIRQFMHADDFAKIIYLVIKNNIYTSFNIAPDETKTIHEIADIAIKACNIPLQIKFDTTKPNGQYRKDVTTTEIKNIFPDFKFISLEDGIKNTFYEYEKNKSSFRHD